MIPIRYMSPALRNVPLYFNSLDIAATAASGWYSNGCAAAADCTIAGNEDYADGAVGGWIT